MNPTRTPHPIILPPPPAAHILLPLITAFLATVTSAIALTLIPSPAFFASGLDYQRTIYEYYPPENQLISVAARSTIARSGDTTERLTLWTFDKDSNTPYSLEQILRDPAYLSALTAQPLTEEALQTSFIIDRTSQELITSPSGTEHRIKLADLEGQIKSEYSESMFGLNPFAYKKPGSVDCAATKCLALTFDDGPSGPTSRLLDILDYHHARATFFPLGQLVSSYPDTITRMARAGHDIGSHSWNHKYLPRLSYSAILNDLTVTTNAIQPITGQRVKFLRPPYGAYNRTVTTAAAALDQQIVLWTIDPWDWQHRNASYICDQVASHAHPGGIILLHDIYDPTIDAAACILNRLSHEYTFVNLSTLLK